MDQYDLNTLIYRVKEKETGLYKWDWEIIIPNESNLEEEDFDLPLSYTYKEARLACLTKLIEILENEVQS